MVIGMIDVMVEAIPAVVCCNDISCKDTPRNGPNMEPKLMSIMAFLSTIAFFKSSHLFR